MFISVDMKKGHQIHGNKCNKSRKYYKICSYKEDNIFFAIIKC